MGTFANIFLRKCELVCDISNASECMILYCIYRCLFSTAVSCLSNNGDMPGVTNGRYSVWCSGFS